MYKETREGVNECRESIVVALCDELIGRPGELRNILDEGRIMSQYGVSSPIAINSALIACERYSSTIRKESDLVLS